MKQSDSVSGPEKEHLNEHPGRREIGNSFMSLKKEYEVDILTDFTTSLLEKAKSDKVKFAETLTCP